jgi:hypothetical protein
MESRILDQVCYGLALGGHMLVPDSMHLVVSLPQTLLNMIIDPSLQPFSCKHKVMKKVPM